MRATSAISLPRIPAAGETCPSHTVSLLKKRIAIYIVLTLLWCFFNQEEGGRLFYHTRAAPHRVQRTPESWHVIRKHMLRFFEPISWSCSTNNRENMKYLIGIFLNKVDTLYLSIKSSPIHKNILVFTLHCTFCKCYVEQVLLLGSKI